MAYRLAIIVQCQSHNAKEQVRQVLERRAIKVHALEREPVRPLRINRVANLISVKNPSITKRACKLFMPS